MCFVKEPTEIEESALSCHLSRRLGNTNAAFVIINSLTITFVTNNNDDILLSLMNSHPHDIEELLKWLKAKLSILKLPDYHFK